MKLSDKLSGKAWIAVGDMENWELGLENGIWGIVPELDHHWGKLDKNDLVLFYCKSPIAKFFGAGALRSKFKQTLPLWKEEVQEKRVIWPYRFEFDVIHILPIDSWKKLGISNKDFNFPVFGGLNPVADFAKAMKLLETLTSVIGQEMVSVKDIPGILYEIGKIQRMVVETRYPVDGYLLDVIWKRIIRSVPTYAFSVNLEGEFDRSIRPLKHAYDLWNTRPFLITMQNRLKEAEEITSGLYHEFSATLKTLSTVQVQDLYNSKKTYYELEEKYGLR